MQEFILEWIKSGLSSFDADILKVVSILTENFWGNGNLWYAFAITMSNAIKPIALTIIGICFIIEFLDITARMDILKFEFMLRIIFKFLMARVTMDISFFLLEAIYLTVAEWVATVGVSGSSIGQITWTQIEPLIEDYGMLEMIGMVVSMGLMFIIIFGVSKVVQVIAYARKFEMVMYLSVAPLPCAFLPMEAGGANRITKKYFLSFAGTCLQGLFIIMSIRLYGVLCTDEIQASILAGSNLASIVGDIFIASLVLVMAVVKSGSWANRILDVT